MNAFMLKAEEVARVNATAKTSSAAVRRFRFGNGFYRRSPNR